MSVCLLAVGSNQGDCRARIFEACDEIGGGANTRVLKVSTLLETAPVGAASKKFLNGCLLIETSRSPQQLMRDLLDIETALGRKRNQSSSLDRTIDLDVLLYGDQIVCSDIALIPHPRMSFRRFVLEPAVEIAAELRHPLFDASMTELLGHIDGPAKRIVVALSTRTAQHHVAIQRPGGWSIEFVEPAGDNASLELLLQETSLLIEFVDTPLQRSDLWQSDYRGPRWQVGKDVNNNSNEQLELLFRTAIQSMGPLS